jgi:hypothetical protein
LRRSATPWPLRNGVDVAGYVDNGRPIGVDCFAKRISELARALYSYAEGAHAPRDLGEIDL